MHDLLLRSRGCFRYFLNGGISKRDWTSACLILSGEWSDACVILDLQEAEYETLDLADTKITIPLRQFRVCKKKTNTESRENRDTDSTMREFMKIVRIPSYQIYLSSRIIFAKKQLWLGFYSPEDHELWYPKVKAIVRRQIPKGLGTSKDFSVDGSQLSLSQTSELDLLAAALPSIMDNEIYESTLTQDDFKVTVIQTEKARELDLQGEYTLRLNSIGFELRDPTTLSRVQIWPLVYVRKFGVHRKRFYLISGSRCTGGHGLFIFFVREAEKLQDKLLSLMRQASFASPVIRHPLDSHFSPKSTLHDENNFMESAGSPGLWLKRETTRKTRLPSPPGSELQQKTPQLAKKHHGNRSPRLASPVTPLHVTRLLHTPEMPESPEFQQDEKIINGRRYTEHCCQTIEDEDIEGWHRLEGFSLDPATQSIPQRSSKRRSVSSGDPNSPLVSEAEETHALYANADQFGGTICQEYRKENEQTEQPLESQEQCQDEHSEANAGDSYPLSNTFMSEGQQSSKEEWRRWRIGCVFEPIDEQEERSSASSLNSSVNHQTTNLKASISEDNQVVSSSTPGDDVHHTDDGRSQNKDEVCKNILENVPPEEAKHIKRVMKDPKLRRLVARSATWDGWMDLRKKMLKSTAVGEQDVSVQTEQGSETSETSGSDIIAQTVF
ncbi:unnamed protein product [Calicophoron daubneyi]|uniref:IRS-type PTB domain-containing protein n=1 Tax=Calicophoron daubneyi TaxID=300641 RepID=A0AAV2TRL2_CALDB